MDGKDHSGRPPGSDGSIKRRSGLDAGKDRRRIIKFFQTQRDILVRGFLVAAIGVLLLGIFSQLRPPSTDEVPSGETMINYSIFLTQVNAGNVLAVIIRGNGASALLQKSLTQRPSQRDSALSPAQRTAQIEAWTQYVRSATWASWNTQTLNIDPGRLVYTHLPVSETGHLISLLMSKQVSVTELPPAQAPIWTGLLWKFTPLLFLLMLVVMVLAPHKQANTRQNINDYIAQFKKQQSHRIENIGTQKPTDAQGKKLTPGEKSKFSSSASTPSGSASVQPVKLNPPTTFADVAGIDQVRIELEEIVQFLRTPEKFDRLGAHIPRGALLVGPPGTGKTLLARAVAGEAGVPFFSMSASEFVEMFVGVGASRVHDLFNQARQMAPAVIFIDELDAVGRKRAMRAIGSDERDQTLNQLLVEMDGFNTSHAVVVLAATNRVDILDKALLRPGRFDRHMIVPLPDRAGRQAILQIHTAKTPLHEEVSLERLARLTTGMSGADLANLVNEAALCAARKDLERVDHDCFEDALARVQLGALRPLVLTEVERRTIAYHEGGHALVAHYLKDADTVNRVTILPYGQSLGVTQFVAEEDRYNYSREMLMAKITVGLAGRVAEELTLGRERVTTGAEHDFQVVTSIARRMVTRWGMSDRVGVVFADYGETGAGLTMHCLDPSTLSSSSQTLAMEVCGRLMPNGRIDLPRPNTFAVTAPVAGPVGSSDMASVVDREIKKIVDEGYETAQRLLQEHFVRLQRLADTLMERERLSRAEFEALMQN